MRKQLIVGLLLLLAVAAVLSGCSTRRLAPPTGPVYARLAEVHPVSGYPSDAREAGSHPRFILVFDLGDGVREAYAVDSPAQTFHGHVEVGEWYKINRTRDGVRWRLSVRQKGRGL